MLIPLEFSFGIGTDGKQDTGSFPSLLRTGRDGVNPTEHCKLAMCDDDMTGVVVNVESPFEKQTVLQRWMIGNR